LTPTAEPLSLLPYQGEALFFPGFLAQTEADRLFRFLLDHISWQQQSIRIFGRSVMQPRLTASFADEGVSYVYSGIALASETWNPELADLKRRIEKATGCTFNTALLNLYRDGNDSMGWHRDNERELGPEPVVASLSLGATRRFLLREYHNKSNRIAVELSHGSLLLMRGECQEYWEHSVPKTKSVTEERINITFRQVTG
jgi:alkylated DNA repair dioxygenase AlkB